MCECECKEDHVCGAPPTDVLTQSLAELDFERSIHHAAHGGNVKRVAELLRNTGSAANVADAYGYTALHYAARGGHLEVARLLLAAGAHPNCATTGKATALHRCAYGGHLTLVQLLLKHGANVAAQDADGQTALHKAAGCGHIDICTTLLDVRPDLVRIPDKRGRTAWNLACARQGGCPAALEAVLRHN